MQVTSDIIQISETADSHSLILVTFIKSNKNNIKLITFFHDSSFLSYNLYYLFCLVNRFYVIGDFSN